MTYSCCELCPNECRVDRTAGQVGRCGMDGTVKIAWAGLHRGEEPPVSGRRGSGMIFFCGCPLHCQYCQNYQISQGGWDGVSVSDKNLASIMIALRDKGAVDAPSVAAENLPDHVAVELRQRHAHGVFRAIMDWCFSRDCNIRIDTHRDNRIMQHVILGYGFSYCGIIYLASGDERLAYQKIAATK